MFAVFFLAWLVTIDRAALDCWRCDEQHDYEGIANGGRVLIDFVTFVFSTICAAVTISACARLIAFAFDRLLVHEGAVGAIEVANEYFVVLDQEGTVTVAD